MITETERNEELAKIEETYIETEAKISSLPDGQTKRDLYSNLREWYYWQKKRLERLAPWASELKKE